MTKILRQNNQLVLPPWYFGAIMGFFSLAFYFIPNQIYSSYIHEPANLYLNYKAMTYIAGSTIIFVIFTRIGFRSYNPGSNHKEKIGRSTASGVSNIVAVLLVVNLFYIVYTIGLPNLLSIYASSDSQNGNYIKLQLSQAISSGKLGWISDLSIALIVWSFWSALERRSKSLYFRLLVNVLLYFASSLISVSRDNIISLVVMLVCIYLGFLAKKGRLNLGSFLGIISAFIVFFGVTFSVVGLARSSNITSASYEITKQFMGYFPASYNRFAYVIDGKLEYPNANWGYYSTQFIWDIPFISGGLDIYGFGKRFGYSAAKVFSRELAESIRRSTAEWVKSFIYMDDYIWIYVQ